MKFAASLAFIDPTEYGEIAVAADAAKWDALVVSDHLVHPAKISSAYPYTEDGSTRWKPDAPWPDPWVAIGAMGAVTERIRFLTGVYVLPLRNPILVAKAVGTAALMSGNRVSLGIGVGWMRDEFELLEQRFERRGRRADEMIQVMRTLWRGGMVEHHGEFYDFEPLQMSPAPTAPIPLLGGGLSEPALRRVGCLLDGWISDLHTAEELSRIIGTIRAYREEYGRADAPLEIVAACSDVVDVDGFRRLEDAGVTQILTKPWVFYCGPKASLRDKCEALVRYAGEIIDPMSQP